MLYPEPLKTGDVIGITAMSNGIIDETDCLRANNAKKNLEKRGFIVKETKNVRTHVNARSSSKEQRAKEFMELWKDEKVKSIIIAEGGDFLCEVLDELDFDELKKYKPKWVQGYSDVTNLSYVFTTNLDIATIYGPTYKSFGMDEWHISLENSIKLMRKEELVQNSYEKCEEFKGWDKENKNPYSGYDLTKNVKWVNLNGEDEIQVSGRCIGGCLDVIAELIGTKYDKTKEYIKKYKNDGIIWFLEIFEASTPDVYRKLWQMKNSGYFENCKGIIFGRPLIIREDYGLSYYQMIRDALKITNIPIICDIDIGHVAPQIPIVTGSILKIMSKDGKGNIKNIDKL